VHNRISVHRVCYLCIYTNAAVVQTEQCWGTVFFGPPCTSQHLKQLGSSLNYCNLLLSDVSGCAVMTSFPQPACPQLVSNKLQRSYGLVTAYSNFSDFAGCYREVTGYGPSQHVEMVCRVGDKSIASRVVLF